MLRIKFNTEKRRNLFDLILSTLTSKSEFTIKKAGKTTNKF